MSQQMLMIIDVIYCWLFSCPGYAGISPQSSFAVHAQLLYLTQCAILFPEMSVPPSARRLKMQSIEAESSMLYAISVEPNSTLQADKSVTVDFSWKSPRPYLSTSAWYLPRLHHLSVLFLESLTKPFSALHEFINAAHNAAFLLLMQSF